MGLVICLMLGAFAGWLVSAIQEVDEGIFARMGIGMLGGLIGNLLAGLFHNVSLTEFMGLSWSGAVLSIIGAFALLGIARRTTSRSNYRDVL